MGREAPHFVDEAIFCTFSILFVIFPKNWPFLFLIGGPSKIGREKKRLRHHVEARN